MAQKSPGKETNERSLLQVRCSLGNYLAIGTPTFDCAIRHGFCSLPLIDYEGVVLPKLRPRAVRHFTELHKFPIGHVGISQVEIITHRGRNIETGALV